MWAVLSDILETTFLVKTSTESEGFPNTKTPALAAAWYFLLQWWAEMLLPMVAHETDLRKGKMLANPNLLMCTVGMGLSKSCETSIPYSTQKSKIPAL